MVFDDHGNRDCRRALAPVAIPISRPTGHFVDILVSQHRHVHRSITFQFAQTRPMARNYPIDVAASRSISFLVLPCDNIFDYRGTIPMGLATIITMLIYVAAPLSPGFVDLVQVLFWVDVVISLLSCFAVPLFMYVAPQPKYNPQDHHARAVD